MSNYFMKRILVLYALALAFAACNKDKVESKPHVSFKSFNTSVVPFGVDLQATLEFTDQEGDLDSVYVIRQRINQNDPNPENTLIDLGVPVFGNQNRGELSVSLPNATHLTFNLPEIHIPGSIPQRNEPDTLHLSFYLKDKAGNVSDTTSPKEVIVMRSL